MNYATVILDVDSTLCGVEGIDWLAQRRGPDVAQRIAGLTDRAMSGEINLDAVYGERLAMIRPTRMDIDALAGVYNQTLAIGAMNAITTLRLAGVRILLASSGIRQAIAPLALSLSVELYAVDLLFNARGEFLGFDPASPLVRQHGKRDLVRILDPKRPILAVGDGATDLAMRSAVDRFVAYTGFVRRAAVVEGADAEIGSFAELADFVLTKPESGRDRGVPR